MTRNPGLTLVDSLDGIDAVRTTYYGLGKGEKANVILMAQHGGDSRQLVSRFNGAFADNPQVLDDYLKIDRDACTPELAHAIAAQIAGTTSGLQVKVVEVLYERGILDPNRIAGHAIRNVLRHGDNSEVLDLLMRLHLETVKVINAHLRDLAETDGGLFVDLHSMAPYEALGLEGERPGHLVAYNYAYSSRERRGERRQLDLITEIPGPRMIANPVLVGNMQSRLDAHGVSFDFNKPYPKADMSVEEVRRVMTTRYMEVYPGMAIDIPKDFLTKHDADHPSWDLRYPEVDQWKIDFYAKIFGPAITESVWDIAAAGKQGGAYA